MILVDKGRRFSRIAQAAAIANIPGRPGISGDELLARGREDLRAFERLCGASMVDVREDTEATAIARRDESFRVRLRDCRSGSELEVTAGAVVLATGLVDEKPGIERFYWKGQDTLSPWVHQGQIGYCLLCEGWETPGKRIAVVGGGEAAVEVARSLVKHFDADVTLITQGGLRPGVTLGIDSERLHVDDRSVESLEHASEEISLELDDGSTERFHKGFFMLGWYKVNNELAVALGSKTTDEGFVATDEHSEVLDQNGERIRGLFAVGDLRAGRWKQIVIGWGDAETAVIVAHARRLSG